VQLGLLFGSPALFKTPDWLVPLRKIYPRAHLWGCSTAGEICGTQVSDGSLVLTAVSFADTQIQVAHQRIHHMEESFGAGQYLGRCLTTEGLVHVLVLSDGLRVNGSELVKGLTRVLPPQVTITGGLAGDGERFQETFVLCDDILDSGVITVLGLYGQGLRIGYGSLGGWDPFGPERLITRSKGNVLYELDGKSALELYRRYLGEHAKGLPATGLLFPLSVRTAEGRTGVVRTILSINEADHSLTFAGDVPEGGYARLMKANFDRLIDGAMGAARTSCSAIGTENPELAILISCVGRKMVLKQRVEEEVEGVRDILGEKACLTGFYSYGEISPLIPETRCELHNQTMTITTLSEH
jgi:hypothetical protein